MGEPFYNRKQWLNKILSQIWKQKPQKPQTEIRYLQRDNGLKGFWQFFKREHKIDITPLLKGENTTDANWNGKQQAVQEDFIWGVGPEALYQITRAEYKTEHLFETGKNWCYRRKW